LPFMMSSAHIEIAPRAAPDAVARYASPGAVLLEAAGPIEDEDHILVLGGQGPELMCALLHAGAANVIHLRTGERPEPDSASLVIIPRVASLDWLATTLISVRRALNAHGRLVVHAGPRPAIQTGIRRMLKLHGMTAIQARISPDGMILSAGPRPRHTA
jgi:hypothetical protein